jgi:hypothetical protein
MVAQKEKSSVKNYLIFLDKLVIVLIIISMSLFRKDFVLIASFFLLIFYLIFTNRIGFFYHLIISSVITILWMIIAGTQYNYNSHFISIFGFNAFPLFAWSLGLFAAYLIYSHYERILNLNHFYSQIEFFTILYWILLICFETFSYHVLNVHNLGTAQYPGLPICDCIHAPLWMQISYFALGPIYFIVCTILRLENPHRK